MNNDRPESKPCAECMTAQSQPIGLEEEHKLPGTWKRIDSYPAFTGRAVWTPTLYICDYCETPWYAGYDRHIKRRVDS